MQILQRYDYEIMTASDVKQYLVMCPFIDM